MAFKTKFSRIDGLYFLNNGARRARTSAKNPCVYSLEPLYDAFCLGLNVNISKLVYSCCNEVEVNSEMINMLASMSMLPGFILFSSIYQGWRGRPSHCPSHDAEPSLSPSVPDGAPTPARRSGHKRRHFPCDIRFPHLCLAILQKL